MLSTAVATAGPPSRVGRVEVTCPVCTRAFNAFAVAAENADRGVDRDLFARAVGPQPEFYRVSTCPRCAYSGYLEDFRPGLTLSPAFVRRVLDPPGLRPDPPLAADTDPADIPVAQRYELAARCYEWQGRPDEARAWLHLRAAWVARDVAAMLPPDAEIVAVMRRIDDWLPPRRDGDNQADRELVLAARLAARLAEGYFDESRRLPATAVLVMLLRRHGENAPARPLLAALLADERVTGTLRVALERMSDSIDGEMRHQRRAAELFRRAQFVGQVSEANRGPARYLLGELYRRLGDRREADDWYRQALNTPSLPDDLRQWAEQQRQALAAPLEPPR